MTLRSTGESYGTLARALHWLSAGLIVTLIPLGVVMTRLNDGDNTALYRAHVALGLLIAVLTVARAVWRFVEPSPATPSMPEWRRWLYLANHYALYVGLFALAITGIVTLVANDQAPFPPSVVASDIEDVRAGSAHFVLALVYAGMLVMHIVGVLSYQRTEGDVLHKMGIGQPQRS